MKIDKELDKKSGKSNKHLKAQLEKASIERDQYRTQNFELRKRVNAN